MQVETPPIETPKITPGIDRYVGVVKTIRSAGSTVPIRPEIRFDHAWDRKACDNGTRQSQLTVATDLIYHFW